MKTKTLPLPEKVSRLTESDLVCEKWCKKNGKTVGCLGYWIMSEFGNLDEMIINNAYKAFENGESDVESPEDIAWDMWPNFNKKLKQAIVDVVNKYRNTCYNENEPWNMFSQIDIDDNNILSDVIPDLNDSKLSKKEIVAFWDELLEKLGYE